MGVGVQVPPSTPNDQGKSPGHRLFRERLERRWEPFVSDLSAVDCACWLRLLAETFGLGRAALPGAVAQRERSRRSLAGWGCSARIPSVVVRKRAASHESPGRVSDQCATTSDLVRRCHPTDVNGVGYLDRLGVNNRTIALISGRRGWCWLPTRPCLGRSTSRCETSAPASL